MEDVLNYSSIFLDTQAMAFSLHQFMGILECFIWWQTTFQFVKLISHTTEETSFRTGLLAASGLANCGRPQYVLTAAAATKTAKHDKVSRQEYLFKTLSPDWRSKLYQMEIDGSDGTRDSGETITDIGPLDAGSKCVLAFPWNVVIFVEQGFPIHSTMGYLWQFCLVSTKLYGHMIMSDHVLL